MTRSVGLAHVIRMEDGTSEGVWGPFVLRSAFQPVFRFNGGKLEIAAFEGLARPFRDGEPVAPGVFFSAIAGQDRLEVETLTRSLHLINAGACLDPRTSLFVNFDPSVYCDRGVTDRSLRDMRLTMHEAGIAAGRIVAEVTEHKAASHQALMNFVAALRAHGFRIAVDDYGADHSDMSRIRDLKPEIVKFDAAWITRLMDSDPGFELLKAMVDTFNGWGITTLFEGIEEPWQLDLAESSMVRMVQGFVLARPQLAPTDFAMFSRTAAAGDENATRAGAAATGTPAFPDPSVRANMDARITRDAVPARPFRQTRAFGRKVRNG
ncbi:MAG: EAL domain-containing protein [Zhengella sp.]|uniref:EAL domain-containing protein n=1 Tax=Zhengella sp. TaxID=2282762 RepID=UPI001DE02101|nr:EAL domain-containing protein [Notoacmeibacter sp.]MCC0027457.1 EAL domain-containing protein [Brucellaceae bacterium]